MTDDPLFFLHYGPYIIAGFMLLMAAGIVALLIYLIRIIGNAPQKKCAPWMMYVSNHNY